MEIIKLCQCGKEKSLTPQGSFYCKPCHSLTMAKWRKQNKEKIRAIGRAYSYKLSSVQYTELMTSQKGKCAICKIEFTERIKPHVDHNHSCCPTQKTCGKCIRGLLCTKCNTMLGHANDSPELLKTAIRYLKR
jgi:hypothetical protein